MSMDFFKTNRVLDLYADFIAGKTVNKQAAASQYHVDVRSIQRDIDCIRNFLAEQNAKTGNIQTIDYDKHDNCYRLNTQHATSLSPGEILAVCKILLESRAFSKEQICSYLQTIIELCVPTPEKDAVQKCVANELFYYINPAHPAVNSEVLWALSQAAQTQRIADIDYLRLKDGKVVTRRVHPVGLLFSEYYFYLMAVIESPEVRCDFDKKEDPFPTIYRVDRIQKVRLKSEHFSVPYAERFKEGDYKNRVQYMFGGEPQKVVFEYSGPSIEAVLDRFPTAVAEEQATGLYTVTADVFGDGVIMWLLSQGSKVRLLGPAQLREKLLNEVAKMASFSL